MNNYATILEELEQDLIDSILDKSSVIQVDFQNEPYTWYYSDATMQRDFLSAKKDLDEGSIDFIMFEKIQAIYDNYQEKRKDLSPITVEEAIQLLKEKLNMAK